MGGLDTLLLNEFKSMLQLTKVFHFEAAHAILGYPGGCRYIHGHSYELHVTVSGRETEGEYIPPPGLVVDFKELKRLVTEFIVNKFDHQLVLSRDYIAEHPEIALQENLLIMETEPSAENLLIYMHRILLSALPSTVNLAELKLYETKDSFAKWMKHHIDL